MTNAAPVSDIPNTSRRSLITRYENMDDDTSGQEIATQITRIDVNAGLSDDHIRRIANFTCNSFNITNAVISIAIVDNENIREINKQFLQSDNITDCISFDLSDNDNDKSFEIIVNAELAKRQAKTKKHSADTELALYIVHGLLHQMGFDDIEPGMAEKMHNAEEKILCQLGYDFSYNE